MQIDGLNSPIKIAVILRIKKKKTYSDTSRLKVKAGKKHHQNIDIRHKKAGVNTLKSDKINFKTKTIIMAKEVIQGGWKMGKMSEGGQKI